MTADIGINKILLVGTGPMAEEYLRVLIKGYGLEVGIAGRDRVKVEALADKWNLRERFLTSELTAQKTHGFTAAVLATSSDSLPKMLEIMIAAGLRAILAEKPAALSPERCMQLFETAKRSATLVKVATNRRYYQSVRTLKKIIASDSPVSAYFDFSEPAQSIGLQNFAEESKTFWAYANSIHVFDTVKFLLGNLRIERADVHDRGAVSWHGGGNTFSGLMTSEHGVPVVYHACWIAPGRWDIQILTRAGRYKLSPMERLQVMRPGTFDWSEVEVDYSIDNAYKPGVFAEVGAFLAEARAWVNNLPAVPNDLPDLGQNAATLRLIRQVAGYAS